MKNIKILAVALFACISMWATAAVTAKMTIKVQGTLYDEILIVEDDATAADFSDPNNAPKQMNTANSWCLNIYAMNGTTKMGAVAIPDVEGLKLQFKSSVKEGNYTMSFSDLEGTEYFLQKGEDAANLISMDDDYAFSCTPGDVVEFTIVKQAAPAVYTRNVTAGQWGTICYPAEITAVQGGTLYSLTSATETEVKGEEVVTFPTVAGQPYVFQADAEATQLVMPYTAGSEVLNPVPATGLVGTFFGLEGVPAGAYGIMNNYVVEIAAGNPLLANRAYINLSELKDVVGAPGRTLFHIANAPTNLNEVAAGMADGTYMINGQVVIVKDGKGTSVLGLGL